VQNFVSRNFVSTLNNTHKMLLNEKITFLTIFREIFLRNSAKFREIIYTKFREINFYFRINFAFREIKKGPFVSTLGSTRSYFRSSVAESTMGMTQNNLKCTKCCSLDLGVRSFFTNFLYQTLLADGRIFRPKNSRGPKNCPWPGKSGGR
jgi:hypothetical protein